MSNKGDPFPICILCGSSEIRLFARGINPDSPSSNRVPVFYCARCGLGQSVPEDSPSVHDLYGFNYYGTSVSGRLLNRIALALFSIERRSLSVTNSQAGKILDFGCGDGTFLLKIPNEWQKYGYEESHGAIVVCKQRGITLLDKQSFDCHRSTFDMITLWQSLEHIESPLSVLYELKSLLSVSGKIVISVPNRHSFQARVFRGSWFHLDPLRHIFHYSPTSLCLLLKKCGFEVISINHFSLEYGVFGWLQSLLNACGIKFNLLYKLLKGRLNSYSSEMWQVPIPFVFIISFLVLPIALGLSIIESVLKMGGVITVTAKRGLDGYEFGDPTTRMQERFIPISSNKK